MKWFQIGAQMDVGQRPAVELQQRPAELAQVWSEVDPLHLAGRVELVMDEPQRLDAMPDGL